VKQPDTFRTSTDSSASPRGRVVVADDDAVTRTLICRILTAAEFTVHAVENGQLAYEAVQLFHPDVILLDWEMPIMDGLCAAKLLKADIATRAIPIVMITAHAQTEERSLALEAGVQDFVSKPFGPGELIACMDQQMRWRTIITTARATDRRGQVSEPCAPRTRHRKHPQSW